MRLFFATSTLRYRSSLVKNDIKNILFAYPYAKKTLLKEFDDYLTKVQDVNLLLDSGAFSVWTLGETMDLEKYKDFCLVMMARFKDRVKSMHIVNLDVIPGRFGVKPTAEQVEESAKQGRKNYQYLLKNGIQTIPVYHQHEDIKWLKLMEKDTDYVGISPANDCSTENRMIWMDEVYDYLRARIKTHSFGGVSERILRRYPLYSGDSSSWVIHYRYGKGMKFNLSSKVRPVGKVAQEYMTDCEVREYKAMETFITKLWESRGVIWNQ